VLDVFGTLVVQIVVISITLLIMLFYGITFIVITV